MSLDPEQRLQAIVVWCLLIGVVPLGTVVVLGWVLIQQGSNPLLVVAGTALVALVLSVVCWKVAEGVVRLRYPQ